MKLVPWLRLKSPFRARVQGFGRFGFRGFLWDASALGFRALGFFALGFPVSDGVGFRSSRFRVEVQAGLGFTV